MSSAPRLVVPYTRRGPLPRARLAGLGCACGCGGGRGLGRLGELPGAADWQVSRGALQREVRRAVAAARAGTLGALGLNQGESGAIKGAGTGAKVGSVVPVIGTAVGAVVGAIAGYLLGAKHYFNVGQSNAQCQQLLQAWQQYRQIQGHVAGRALGWQTMQQLFHAAVGAGLFPGNDMHLKFHEGTLQCAGHGDWVDDFLGTDLAGKAVNNCGAHNCMADALARFQQQRAQVPRGTADAVYFVDALVLPMNATAQIPWIYNGGQDPVVHQLMYDLADAYLAQHVGGTTPYVQFPAAQTGTPTAGAVGVAPAPPAPSAPAAVPYVSPSSPSSPSSPRIIPTVDPGYGVPPTTYPATDQLPAVVPPEQTNSLISAMLAQGASAQQAYTQALQSLAANGVNTQAPAVQQQVAGAVQAAAAGTGVSSPAWWIAGAGLLAVAVVMGVKDRRKR